MTQDQDCRFFVSYTGVKLPFTLVNPVPPEALPHRNTFIRAFFRKDGRISGFEKVVYGEVELSHRYEYHANGALMSAEIAMIEEDAVTLCFDETGAPL